jgi:hypothetical protein
MSPQSRGRPRLHVALHQVVANQLLADDPPQTWQTVRRLARLGYDWHNIMHMIATLVTEDVYGPSRNTASPIRPPTPGGWRNCPPTGHHQKRPARSSTDQQPRTAAL